MSKKKAKKETSRIRTYKFKAVVSKTTATNAENWLSLCQQLYNICLEQRIVAYKRCSVTLNGIAQKNELPGFKEAFPEFAQVGSQVLQEVVERVERSFQSFFSRLRKKQGKAGFPRFRSIHRYDSFTLKTAGWKLDGRHLKITNVGIFKLHLSHPIEGRIKTITVTRDGLGNWWVCLTCDQVPAKEYDRPMQDSVGIDVGLNHFCVDTDPDTAPIENPRHYRKLQAKLRKQQRQVSRRKKGSNRRKKAVKQLKKTHRKIFNLRQDFLHKASFHYVNRYQNIYIEDLQVTNMVKNKHLSKSIADAGWSTFFDMLTYKAEGAGRKVYRVDPKGTSQNCSGCGEKVPKSLAVRVHRCTHCGLELDRDLNAAENIRKRGAGQTLQALT